MADSLLQFILFLSMLPSMLLRGIGIIPSGWEGLGVSLLIMMVAGTFMALLLWIPIHLFALVISNNSVRKKIRKAANIILIVGIALDVAKPAIMSLVGSMTPAVKIRKAREALKPKTDKIDAEIRDYITINSLKLIITKNQKHEYYEAIPIKPKLIWDINVKKAGEYQFMPSGNDATYTFQQYPHSGPVFMGILKLNPGQQTIETNADGYSSVEDCTTISTIQISVSYLATYSDVYGADYPGLTPEPNVDDVSVISAKQSFPIISFYENGSDRTHAVSCVEVEANAASHSNP